MNKFFLDPDHYHLSSATVQQKTLGMWRGDVLGKKVQRFACSLLLHHALLRCQLESTLLSSVPRPGLLYFSEFAAYDETPMVCKVQNPQEAWDRDSFRSAGPSQEETSWQVLLSFLSQNPKVDKVVAKVFQSRSSAGYVVQLSETMLLLLFEGLTPLQIMSHNRAEVLVEILQRLSLSSPSASCFKFHGRGVCADKAQCNPRAENMLLTREEA